MLQHVRFGSKNHPQRCRKCDPRDDGALQVGFSLILGLALSALLRKSNVTDG
jgi:hypothetical protein